MAFHVYKRRVQFYETDMMGIVHHANYLRLFEEARVDWVLARKLIEKPEEAAQFAVLETRVRHIKPARFGDQLQIQLQAQLQGVRILLEYKMYDGDLKTLFSEARTEHVAIDTTNYKLVRPSPRVTSAMETEPWTETWLSNL